MRIKAKKAIRDLSTVIKLDNQVLENTFYLASGDEANVILELTTKLDSKKEVNKSLSYEILAYPNPFNDHLEIKFMAESEINHNITIRDLNGREVWSMNRSFQQGINVFNVPNTLSLPIGVYIVSIQADDSTKKFGKILKME